MRKEVDIFQLFSKTMEQLSSNGLLLVSGKTGNPMTIGWGTIGIVWGKPIFIVFVRPSRYSHEILEECDCFSVNVPSENLNKELTICGIKSGRDTDKIAECGFTLERGIKIETPYIKNCPIHYECRILYKHKINEIALDKEIISLHYPDSDFHTVYFGEIFGAFQEQE